MPRRENIRLPFAWRPPVEHTVELATPATYFHANRGVMASFLPADYARVLEVGCAAGGFSTHLTRPCEIWGIEPNGQAAELARSRLHKVLRGFYSDVAAELPDNYFDLVICNDVIEHMPDHDQFLEEIRTKMKPSGCIVGSIPNIRHVTALFKLLVARDFPYANSGILDRTHLRFFTQKSLLRAFRQHGYIVEDMRGIGSVIVHGLSRPDNPLAPWKNTLFKLASASVVLLTLGFYWDTQFPQFGFRVRTR